MIDYAKIAQGATVATDAELPPIGGRSRTTAPNPFVELVTAAKKDGKRRDLPGRFSLAPYEGRKAACEAYTVVGKLHAAARQVGCKLNVRRLDPNGTDTGITFKVAK